MIRGLYIGGLGMQNEFCALEVVSNNIANINTIGFKEDILLVKEFPRINLHRLSDEYLKIKDKYIDRRPKVGELGTGIGFHKIATLYTQGPLLHTTNKTDLAIEGEGFFVVRAGTDYYYTRAGNFILSPEGYITTQEGYILQGVTQGDINIEKAKDIKITEDGSIYVDISEEGDWSYPKLVDRIKIVSFEDLQGLIKQGHGLFKATEYAGAQIMPTKYKILQGYIEQSNVDAIRSLVNIVNIHRLYEINQKTVSVFDVFLDNVINRLGRVT